MDVSQLVSAMAESLTAVGGWLRAHQPRLVGAAALLLSGWLLALLMRLLASRLIRLLGRIVPGTLLRRGLPPPTVERQVSDVIGLIVFWAVLLFFVAAAADTLGLSVLSASLAALGSYTPRLLGAVLVAVLGLILGNVGRDAVTTAAAAAGAPLASTIGQVARVAILVAAAIIAVGELGIDVTLLTTVLSVMLGAVLAAFALAFGLGAKGAVSNIIGAHYLRQMFETGQDARFGEIEGRIAAITATTVVLHVPEGQVVIPASRFHEAVSMLVTRRARP